jgi:hypothetical protein
MLEAIVSHYFSPLLASTIELSTATISQPLIDDNALNILSHTLSSCHLLSLLQAVLYEPRHIHPPTACGEGVEYALQDNSIISSRPTNPRPRRRQTLDNLPLIITKLTKPHNENQEREA